MPVLFALILGRWKTALVVDTRGLAGVPTRRVSPRQGGKRESILPLKPLREIWKAKREEESQVGCIAGRESQTESPPGVDRARRDRGER